MVKHSKKVHCNNNLRTKGVSGTWLFEYVAGKSGSLNLHSLQ
jgi:hypothetical protein